MRSYRRCSSSAFPPHRCNAAIALAGLQVGSRWRSDARVLLTPCGVSVMLCIAFCLGLSGVVAPRQANAQDTNAQEDDWAGDYLRDPLAQVPIPNLEQLLAAIADPQFQDRVFSSHYPRALRLSEQERREFLLTALQHDMPQIQQQAAVELARRGMLVQVIRQALQSLSRSDQETLREAAIIGLEGLTPRALASEPAQIDRLVRTLTSQDDAARHAARTQLMRLGPQAVPALLAALNKPEQSRAAAELLGRIAAEALSPIGSPAHRAMLDAPPSSMPSPPQRSRTTDSSPPSRTAGPPRRTPDPPSSVPLDPDFGPASTYAKSAPGMRSQLPQREEAMLRDLDESNPQTVRVYYGTNREILEQPPQISPLALGFHVVIAFIAVGLPVYAAGRLFLGPAEPQAGKVGWTRRAVRRAAILWLVSVVIVGLGSIHTFSETIRLRYSERQGVVFGPRRGSGMTIHYGYCDVSIPPTHRVGEVAAPRFGREDKEQHVVLTRAELLAEEAFFAQLQEVMQQYDSPHSCFVFVHGFNVSFDAAAKRTAQIYHDLKFQGVPIFYAWPSRGSVRHYFSDRNEVLFSRKLMKAFLLNVVERSGAERVHVIAHSMGADAVTGAIASLPPDKQFFDQIILAAPDIDADVFLTQIVPRLRDTAQRTTLYCSRNDWALHASYHFNDSWRAGDSSRGLLVAPGMDTIDASSIDTELLGHSYYGNCIDILEDVAQLFLRNPEPAARNLVNLPDVQPGPAWTFPRLLTDQLLPAIAEPGGLADDD